MPAIDYLFSVGWLRRAVWKFWYPLLTRRLRGEEVLFLNYAYEEEPAMGIPLAPADEPDRACIQLYHHVATQVEPERLKKFCSHSERGFLGFGEASAKEQVHGDPVTEPKRSQNPKRPLSSSLHPNGCSISDNALEGQRVLEVSCGHGGGASYLARTFRPESYTGLDLNAAGIAFCRERHRVAGLAFVAGDAEKLPFAAGSFDVVINVEASHCYPAFPRFLDEVARVLRPGGHFAYADFRFPERLAEWDAALASAPLQWVRSRNLNTEVLRGMKRNSERSLALVARHLPKVLQSLGRDFAGIKGSRVYQALEEGKMEYRSYCFRKG